jgi:ABC-2 type transport system ATP-binding protein
MGLTDKNQDAIINVMGYQPGCWPDEIKNDIGYVPQRFYGFDALSILDVINTLKPFYKNWDDALVERLITEFDLPLNQKIKKLSEGQKQLVSIVLAMAFHPKLLVLDEPVASLDPLTRRLFLKNLIDNHCDQNTSVIFSTHITSDLERIASDVFILKDGSAVISGDLEDIRESIVRITFTFPQSKKQTEQFSLEGLIVYSRNQTAQHQQILFDKGNLDIEKVLTEKGASNIHIEHINLDELFLELHS